MKWVIRHTERLLRSDQKWKKTDRFKENEYDMPITSKGKKYLIKAVNEMTKVDEDFDKIEYIYSSPSTRCVETSIEIQKNVYKLTKKFLPIRIDYGLRELHPINYYDHLKLKNGKIEYNVDFKKEIILDKKLHLKNLIKKYNVKKPVIDKKYKSQTGFDDSKYKSKDQIEGANFALKSFKRIIKNNKNDHYIICSHSVAIQYGLTAFTNKLLTYEIKKHVMGDNNWASLTGISNTKNKKYPHKITYGPSAEYWK